ncbi:pilin [Pseudoalteromonas aurantia]|uniref:Type IV pilus assembly protein PilA n=1 Tax=Pseudoalteromonas aurantia 208 TaxID=1314867 RepID=A0ABR9EEH6_9GAMM|nr:pilin [Pseudoalteromonas aurantia]MBE0369374.1 type IV pilus assembly protein PilA [Pseudoalteromonas aurantia 208]
MTKQHQGGFTLIELMIVVAIIGILAAVALPQYQDYIAKSQAAESVALAGSAKTAIAEYHQINGSYPTASTVPALSELAATGTYGALAANASGVLVVTMNASGVASAIAGKVFTFTPDTSGNTFRWTCTNNLGTGNEDLAPQNCKGATP